MIQIEEARRTTALRFVAQLDPETVERAARAGIDPARQMLARHRTSQKCRTLVVDGRTIAIGGVVASLLGPAEVWIELNKNNLANKFAVIRVLKNELSAVLRAHGVALASVATDDAVGQRFAQFFGFHLEPSADPQWLIARIET